MDFAIPEELVALRRSFAAFLDREVRPLEERHAEAFHAGRLDDPDLRDAALAVKRRSCHEGFYAAHLPEEVGGWGLSTLGMTFLVEDAAASGMRLAMFAVGPPNPEAPTPLLLDLPRHLWDRYLTPLVRGEQTMCFALTEPEAGSDAQAIKTRAVRDGEDWLLTGRKHYITNADHADFAIVFAVNDPEKRAAGGITAFVVPRDQWEPGKKQLTIADTHPSELVLDGARVPADHVVGEVGLGFFAAMKFLNAGRAFIGAQCLGLAEWCLTAAVEHAKARTAFGKPLGKFQGVSFPLAESKAEIEAMRWLTYHLAWAVDQGDQSMLDASIVKYYDTERAYAVADRCLQVFGGMGLLKEGPVERVLRHLRMLRVVEGASEVQQLVIARSLGL
ncbi:MAG TPA: acyl-CoA dehydrogenase family protein [Frankiaceae bacterium]|nr:acyl-CoA dehydrogenase family protein [Frankiaceae bacterium]